MFTILTSNETALISKNISNYIQLAYSMTSVNSLNQVKSKILLCTRKCNSFHGVVQKCSFSTLFTLTLLPIRSAQYRDKCHYFMSQDGKFGHVTKAGQDWLQISERSFSMYLRCPNNNMRDCYTVDVFQNMTCFGHRRLAVYNANKMDVTEEQLL